jgi:ribonuclease D
MNTLLPPPAWVDNSQSLQNLADSLASQTRVAVDTESNSLHAYQERVCLIQFSFPGTDYLVDPFPFENLSPLAEFFRSTRIEKVFHASEYDVICLKRDYGIEFNHIFDTMVAARILGIHEVGLNNLLKAEFGIDLDKRLQKANWGRRPLPEDYLTYARYDTHYLLDLRDVMERRLIEAGLMDLAIEDFARMTRITVPANSILEDEMWRLHGARDLNPTEAAILLELLRWREKEAERMNRPPFKVISSEQLIMIALSKNCHESSLRNKVRLSPLQLDRYAQELQTAWETGRANPPVEPPTHVKPDYAFRRRLDRLKIFRKTAAEKMKVESDIILPRDLLFELAENPPGQWDEFVERMKPYPWRFHHYGNQIFTAVHPQSARGNS